MDCEFKKNKILSVKVVTFPFLRLKPQKWTTMSMDKVI